MDFIKNLIKKIYIPEPKKILGRWNIDYCDKKINSKIDLSNEDHCGPCGNYILSKMPISIPVDNKTKKIKAKITNKDKIF